MNKINFSLVSQNKNALPSHPQPTTVSSQSKVSWAKVAKGIALLGGLVVAGYSLYLLKGRLSATPPSSCFANGKPAIELNGIICCLGDSNCPGSGPGTFRWSDGTSYLGDMVNGVFTGQGSITLSNGDSYTGDLVDGDRHGQGIYKWAQDGSSYNGAFVHNAHTGTGKFTFADQVSYYKGPFLDGRFSGTNGLLVLKDKESYQGDFVDGLPSGQVTYTLKDQFNKVQSIYEGPYLQGKQHGKGILTFPDGSTCTQEWEHGVLNSHVCPVQSV